MFSPEVDEVIASYGPERVERVHDPELGLTAFIVLDSTKLGPAAGGVRTTTYESEAAAVSDACRLARSMTHKCALGGLDAGGGKAVVMAHDGLQREAAFEMLGLAINALAGDFRTAGDLGTTDADLAAIRRSTRYVHTDTANLAGMVGRGVLRCAEACADLKGRPGLFGLTAAVQGCGDIGAAVAKALHEAGATIRVADVDPARAEAVAAPLNATVVSPAEVLYESVDILAPCAVGDVINEENVGGLRAWAVCGGANHIVANEATHAALVARGILYVPDMLASAGAVIEGIGRTVMGIDDRAPLVDALRHTTRLVLEDAERAGRPPIELALERAATRIAQAG
ncbi:MAG: Glu/Leu/Phe/Val dehydrogenase dimerization domain-containing protein [Sandaracinaceae bacterium]